MKETHKNQVQLLDSYITAMKMQREQEFNELNAQLNETLEHYKPVNLLNRTIKDLRTSPVTKTNLFETMLSVGGGYFSKKLLLGKSNSIIKSMLGYVLQYAVTNFISKKVSP